MSLLSYNRLVELVENGVIDAPIENINGASIDITLAPNFLTESELLTPDIIVLKHKESITTVVDRDHTLILDPGDFVLASSAETFNLPDNIACEYKLKSSLARSGLQHMLAGWCDPGWNNSRLTLEFKNVTQYHALQLDAGMKIGQMVFFECDPVPANRSYSKVGQYNDQDGVTGNKGLR